MQIADYLPDSIATPWAASRAKYRNRADTSPSNFFDVLYGTVEKASVTFKQRAARAVLDTGPGKEFQKSATRETLIQYARNPANLLVIVVVLGALFYFVRGRS